MSLRIPRVPLERHSALPVQFKDLQLDCGHRLDLLAAKTVAVGIEAVESFLSIHEAQLLTYLKLGG